MIYGLYLSATGVLTNSYKQDVIANNLANAETVGFKRSMALFQQRRAEAQIAPDLADQSDPRLAGISGGTFLSPTFVDHTEGVLERTSSNLDVAIHGNGYLAVRDGEQTRLTRNGQMMLDRNGNLILADGSNHPVLDAQRRPIQIPAGIPQSQIEIGSDGTITAGTLGAIAKLGLFDVDDTAKLRPRGGNLFVVPDDQQLKAADGTIAAGFVEDSNVDPTSELTQLINAQRQLEANANMIRFQDQTLAKAVNDVGKVT
jgi:flagellar basal-body rod protein FlgG